MSVNWDKNILLDGPSAGGRKYPLYVKGLGRCLAQDETLVDVCIFYLILFLSQSNLAVEGRIPTLVTLMLISSDNPLPSDQPLKSYF